MKGKMYFFGLLLMLLALFIAAVQGINWGIEDSWTPDNVRNDPLGAFNTNPERAVSLHPPILDNNEIAKRWFNEGDIAKHIQLQTSYAKTYFEGNGLEGLGGEEYVKHVTDNKVRFANGRSDITISEKIIKNNKVSLDLTKYEQGTIIEPDGTNGFKVITPGKGEVSILADTPSKIDYDAGTFIVGNNKFGAESVSKINVQGSDVYTITTKEGRVVEVISKNGFELKSDMLTVNEGSQITDTSNGAVTYTYGKTQVNLIGGKGYLISGNYLHNFNYNFNPKNPEDISRVWIPSALVKEGNELVLGENIRFCYSCGLDVNNIGDNAIILDEKYGKDFYVSGKAGLTIENSKGFYSSEGLIKGVVYKMNDKGINLIRNPDADELRKALISGVEADRKNFQERFSFVKEEKTRDIIKDELKKLPEKLSDNEIAGLKEKGRYEGKYFGNYKIKELDNRYEAAVKFQVANKDLLYDSELRYNLGKDEWDIRPNKYSLFSNAIVNPQPATIPDYSIKVFNEEEWNIQGGQFYVSGDENPLNLFTDVKFHANGKEGAYHGDVDGKISELVGEQVGGFFGGVAKSRFEGKEVPLLKFDITKDSLVMGNRLTKEVPLLGHYESRDAERLKIGDYSPISMKVQQMVDKGVFPPQLGQIIISHVSDSLAKMQPTVMPNKVEGFNLHLRQLSGNNAEIGLSIISGEGDIVDTPKKTIEINENLIKSVSSNMALLLEKANWQSLYSLKFPQPQKTFSE